MRAMAGKPAPFQARLKAACVSVKALSPNAIFVCPSRTERGSNARDLRVARGVRTRFAVIVNNRE